jgi:hypothetical protein
VFTTLARQAGKLHPAHHPKRADDCWTVSKEQARLAAAIGTHSVRINHSTLYKPCVPATK